MPTWPSVIALQFGRFNFLVTWFGWSSNSCACSPHFESIFSPLSFCQILTCIAELFPSFCLFFHNIFRWPSFLFPDLFAVFIRLPPLRCLVFCYPSPAAIATIISRPFSSYTLQQLPCFPLDALRSSFTCSSAKFLFHQFSSRSIHFVFQVFVRLFFFLRSSWLTDFACVRPIGTG